MHQTIGQRDPAAAFPLAISRDDGQERRQAYQAISASAIGLAVTGLTELLLAVLTGSAGLLGDAIHNLSDVSTNAVVFPGFRLSRRPPTEHYPYGMERAEDLAGIGIAVVIWASAACRGRRRIGARRHSRRRPGPLDQTDPAGRGRGLGRSRPFRSRC
jgi:divalent metal cation (Fe/Co/Zn/Cd) transporter